MHDSLQKALVSVRTVAEGSRRVCVFARKHRATVGKGWSFDVAEPEMTGAEHLLGALAADVITMFLSLAKQRRLAVDEVEAAVQAEMLEPLAHLGVKGAEEAPHYESFSLKAFAGSSAPESDLRAVWAEALHRAPLVNTLRRAANVEAVLQIQL